MYSYVPNKRVAPNKHSGGNLPSLSVILHYGIPNTPRPPNRRKTGGQLFDDLELPGIFPDFPGIFGIKIIYFKSWHWLNMDKQVLWENNLEIQNL